MAATVLGKTRLTEEKIQELVLKAREWAYVHGVQMVPEESLTTCSRALYAPMTLFPSPMPRVVMQQGKQLQRDYNRLMHAVAHDHDFLKESLKNVIKVDSFIQMLWEIYCTVREEGLTQGVSLGLFRNDYMQDATGVCLKQIEFNTVAVDCGGLASGIGKIHRYTMTQAGKDFKDNQMPESRPSLGLAKGLAKAWELYGQKEAVILTVVRREDENMIDIKWLERELFDLDRTISVCFTTLHESYEHSELTEKKCLYMLGREVAVVYYRDGYAKEQYPSNKEIEVRLRFERSRAIKCPSVHYQLAGCKKIQQTLASPGVVEKFVKEQQVCRRIRETFAGQYTLDRGEMGDRAIALALQEPEKFVLKPQKEGGGNNCYDEDMCRQLLWMYDSNERGAYILMERIYPRPHTNHLLRDGRSWQLQNVVTEISFYGTYLGSSTEELLNEEVGHLLRTKSVNDNEGGITAGIATLDSPFLVDTVESKL